MIYSYSSTRSVVTNNVRSTTVLRQQIRHRGGGLHRRSDPSTFTLHGTSSTHHTTSYSIFCPADDDDASSPSPPELWPRKPRASEGWCPSRLTAAQPQVRERRWTEWSRISKGVGRECDFQGWDGNRTSGDASKQRRT